MDTLQYGITRACLYNWKQKYPDISDALKKEKKRQFYSKMSESTGVLILWAAHRSLISAVTLIGAKSDNNAYERVGASFRDFNSLPYSLPD